MHRKPIITTTKLAIMRKYTSKIAIYDASTRVLIDAYTFTSVARCQQINDRNAMSNAKNIYRALHLAELVNRYGEVIYRLVDDGLIDPNEKYVFETL